MADLIALTPCAGLLPLTIGGIDIIEVTPEVIVSVMPHQGKHKDTSAAVKAQTGNALPAINQRTGKGQWFGHDTWLVMAPVTLGGLAAVTDQSDGFAVVAISGDAVEDVLARLLPIDLRPARFKTGHSARTLLGHMSVAITRTGAQRFEIMAMRSMAGTLVHELETAARGLAAR